MNKDTVRTEQKQSSINTETARAARWLFLRRVPAFLDTIIGKFDPSLKIVHPFIKKGQVVADIGCGWGYFTLELANLVGPEGKIFAVDLDQKCIHAVAKKAEKRNYHNIEARASTAADLGFIPDGSVDFIFANGLLCSMASDRQLAVSEMKRILKTTGMAYLCVGTPGPPGFITQPEWIEILAGFDILKGGGEKEWWAVVSPKKELVR